jgi:GT2 family glycosyltransferase
LISLVVATLGRVSELDRLLTSLDAQTLKDFEVLVVDQNADDRLVPLLAKFSHLTIRHLRSQPGVSLARNAGLRAVHGELLAVPDDDCWYPCDLLQQVSNWFHSHSDFDGLLVGLRNAAGLPMKPKWAPGAGNCTRDNVWDCAAAASAFVRRSSIEAVGGFNEQLGPGPAAVFQACEDIDFCIRALALGFRLWYDPGFAVYHPELSAPDRLRRTTYPYALAYGYVLRLHRYPAHYFLRRLARSVGGMLVSLCKLDLANARLYWLRAAGQLRGYLWGPRRIAQVPRRAG